MVERSAAFQQASPTLADRFAQPRNLLDDLSALLAVLLVRKAAEAAQAILEQLYASRQLLDLCTRRASGGSMRWPA